jgi:hypothetical protein
MSDPYDRRIAHLEFRADAQDEKITSLQDTQKLFGDSLTGIQNTLTQIKYALYGAGVMYLISTMGLKETLMQLISK